MTQNNLYMEDENLRLYVDVQPLFLDTLENSKNSAAASAVQASQSAQSASESLTNITTYKTNMELFYAQATESFSNLLSNSLSTLTNAKNTATESINTLKNTVLSSINSISQSVINNIQTTAQNVINLITGYAEDVNNTVNNGVSADYLIQSNAMESGSISNISNVFSSIKSYAHSTFDRSKFTVVGSPTITDDGIASGFSSSSCVQTPILAPTDKSWEVGIEQEITPEALSANTNQYVLFTSTADKGINVQVGYGTADYFLVQMWLPGSQLEYELIRLNCQSVNGNTVSAGDIQGFKVGFDKSTSTYYFKAYKNGVEYASNSGVDSNPINQTANTIIGTRIGSNDKYNRNKINLKSYYVKYDGVTVFSGNKTGLDVIKLDDFTEVGSPTITFDGIASGFSGSNYVYKTITQELSTANSWTIEFSFSYNANASGQYLLSIGTVGNNDFKINLNNDKMFIAIADSNSVRIFDYTSDSLNANTYYKIRLRYDVNSGYYLSINSEEVKVSNSTTHCASTNNKNVNIGYNCSPCSFDLNAFKIYVDGNLVYLPCLKIPYTESKTGSKIVDSVYRSRVNDMYELFGYAPYYTIDETNGNFSLPQGEIYGMIENLRTLIIGRTSE